jgi:hypothetical protein
MKISQYIYIDKAFIHRAYESTHGKTLPSKETKEKGSTLSGGIGVANAGATLNQSKEFITDYHKVCDQIITELNEFPLLTWPVGKSLPDHFWIEGRLAGGTRCHRRGNEIVHEEEILCLYSLLEDKQMLTLLPDNSYFEPGYDQIKGTRSGISVRAKGLFQFLDSDHFGLPVCIPKLFTKLN